MVTRPRLCRLLAAALVIVALAATASPALADAPGNLAARLVAMATGEAVYATDSATRVRVSFESGGAARSVQIVRAGDALVAPAAPAAPAGRVFARWELGGTDLTPYLARRLTDADLAAIAAAAGASPGADNLVSVTAQAAFATSHAARFHQYTRAECAADPSLAATYACTALADAAGSVALANPSASFTPIVEGADAELVAWEAVWEGGPDPAPTYATDATIEGVVADLDFYPVLSTGFVVTLDTGGAPVLESLFVQDTDHGAGTLALDRLPTEQSLAGDSYDPATGAYADGYRGWYQGWTLEGWYATRTGGAVEGYAYDDNDKVTSDMPLSSDTTLYARWVPRNDTPYTVRLWQEDGTGLAREGEYQLAEVFRFSGGTTGQELIIQSNDATNSWSVMSGDTRVAGPYSYDFYHPRPLEEGQEAKVVVTANGQTCVDLYFERDYYSISIKNGSTDLVPVSVRKWGQDIYDWFANSTISYLYNRWTVKYGSTTVDPVVLSGVLNVPRYLDGSKPYTNGGSVTYTKNSAATGYRYHVYIYSEVPPGHEPTAATRDYNGVTYELVRDTQGSSFDPRALPGFYIYRTVGYTPSSGAYNANTVKEYGEDNISQVWLKPNNTVAYPDPGTNNKYYVYYRLRTFSIVFANLGDKSLDDVSGIPYTTKLASYDPGYDSVKTGPYGESWTFKGWYTTQKAADDLDEGSRFDFATATMPSESFALYAGWEHPTFTASFDSGGGSAVAPQTGLTSGSQVTRPTVPTKTVDGVDYTFVGWYKDKELTNPWNFSSDVVRDDDVTLYARWVKGRTYGVTYHDETGAEIEGVDTRTYRYGARATVAPERGDGGGRPFLGWSLVRGNASYVVGQSFTVMSATDLFAVYGDAMPGAGAGDVEAGAPVLTLDSDYPAGVAGHVTQELQVARANDAVTLPAGLAGASARGYHVAGWATEPGGAASYAVGERVAVASDSTLYAVWVANQLTASLDATFTYDGAAHRPAPDVVGWDGSALTAGTDYTLVYDEDAASAGSHGVVVRGAGDYAHSEDVTLSYEVAKRPVTISADNRSSAVGEDLAELTWSMSGTLADPGHLGSITCSTGADRASVGTWPITVSYTANPNYDVTIVPGTYRVSAASLRVTAQGWSGTYDGASHSASVSLSPAAAVEDGASVWFSDTTVLTADNYATAGAAEPPARTHVGTTTVHYYVAGTESYRPDETAASGTVEVSVAPAPLVVSVGSVSCTYGDSAPRAEVTLEGLVGSDAIDPVSVSLSVEGRGGEPYAPGSPAGSYRVVPSGVSAPDYRVSYVPGTLTVGRRVVGVAWSDADSIPYTGSARTYAGATATGILEGDAVSLDVAGATATHAGEYTASVTGLSGARASSYALPAEGLSHGWRVTVAENSATVAIDDWTYGATAAVPTAIAGFGAETATFEYAPAADGEFAPDVPATAGTWWVRAVVAATPDYEGATSPAKAFEVARRPVAINGVGAAGRVYDGTTAVGLAGTPALTAVSGRAHSGPLAGDDVAASAGTAALDSAAAGGRTASFSGFALSGFDAANYELVAQPANVPVTVAPRPLVVTAPSPTVSYGDPAPAYAASLDSFAPGEDVSVLGGELSLSCAYAAGQPAGEYEIVPSGLVTNGNYAISFVPGTLTVSAAANSWVAQPSIAGWVLGQEPASPSASARFGEVSFSYRASGDASAPWSAERPASPGAYEMRAHVAGTDDYGELEATVPFEVSHARVTFDANSRLATGSTADLTGAVGDAPAAPACGYAWEHHDFLGWNTAADGSGEAFAPGDPVGLAAEPRVLYAQWDPRGELAYDGNGATSGATPAQPGSAGEAVTVAACGFAREGYDFAGWNAAADGTGRAYAPGERLELSLGGDVLYAQWRERPRPASKRPMYRLYNPNSGEHFYTASATERDATAAAGWRYEGLGWVAPASGEPVYRLYNANAGDHHYTLSAEERDALVRVGWTYEGVGWFSDPARTVPLWRQYNPNALAGAHNFTVDEREHLALCALGWRCEGIAWYGVR